MLKRFFRAPFILTLPQLAAILIVIGGIIVALDLNRREQSGQLVGVGEADLAREIAHERERQAQLQATRIYVESEDYVADYARNEGGYLLPGEKRVVVTTVDEPAAPPPPELQIEPLAYARPWQAWWRLLTDAPYPTR
jgi:cell division protein FtsB